MPQQANSSIWGPKLDSFSAVTQSTGVGQRNSVVFYLNGRRIEAGPELSALTLAEFLRQEAGLTGTKIVCSEGDCGACSVLRYFPFAKKTQGSQFAAINSCVALVAQMDGSSLLTVEALSDNGVVPALSLVQSAMVNCHASQCGFCTPGFVVAITALVEKKLLTPANSGISAQEAKNAMTGNLCRCTGYQPLIEAACSLDVSKSKSLADRYLSKKQLDDLKKVTSQGVKVESENFSFYAPRSLKEAAAFLKKNKETLIVAAGTDLGVLHNKRKLRLKNLLSLHLIANLYEIKFLKKNRISVGARVTLEQLRLAVKDKNPELAKFFDIFASPQIKNMATLVGNVANASPIAEAPPFLLVSEAELVIVGTRGERRLSLEKFYLAYRKTALAPGEFISKIEFNLPKENEKLKLYKVSERKDLDISTVNAAFCLTWENERALKIKNFKIALGGVAATSKRIYKCEKLFDGAVFSSSLLHEASQTLQTEMAPLGDVRGTSAYRRVLVHNLLRKFFSEVVSVHAKVLEL